MSCSSCLCDKSTWFSWSSIEWYLKMWLLNPCACVNVYVTFMQLHCIRYSNWQRKPWALGIISIVSSPVAYFPNELWLWGKVKMRVDSSREFLSVMKRCNQIFKIKWLRCFYVLHKHMVKVFNSTICTLPSPDGTLFTYLWVVISNLQARDLDLTWEVGSRLWLFSWNSLCLLFLTCCEPM